MIKYISIGIGLLSFGVWMSIIGSPHYIETCIGVIIAVASGFFSYKELQKAFRKLKKTPNS